MNIKYFLAFVFSGLFLVGCNCDTPSDKEVVVTDPLPSWNQGSVKQSIINFVTQISDSTHANFVPVADRIVAFDNDGTLWAEQPVPFQIFFTFDRIQQLAKSNPAWASTMPYKAVIDNDSAAIQKFHSSDIIQLVTKSNAISNIDDFDVDVQQWLATATHPKLHKKYTDLVYQPMLELLDFLRAHQCQIYIVSGGSTEFMRSWVPDVYGIPSQNIIGTSLEIKVAIENTIPVVSRTEVLAHYNDHAGKVISIANQLGKRPVMVVGNSDGDLEMMEYADAGKGPRLMVYLQHTDAAREFLYDEKVPSGALINGLQVAKEKDWTIIDMKNDWKTVYKTVE